MSKKSPLQKPLIGLFTTRLNSDHTPLNKKLFKVDFEKKTITKVSRNLFQSDSSTGQSIVVDGLEPFLNPGIQLVLVFAAGFLYLVFSSSIRGGGRTMKKRSNKRHNKTYKQKR